jgi:RNA polymerase sigma factor (sigma-70 family)
MLNEDSSVATIADFEDTTDRYLNIEDKETLKSLLKACPLTEREKAIIDGHYFKDKRLYDIGRELGITESRISQLHKETLNKLAKYV